MTRVTLYPEAWTIYNELDRNGLLLGLSRLAEERNPEYKWRLLDIFVHRANSTYLGLIYGITRELGLDLMDSITISPIRDINGETLLTMPAIEFLETKCTLYRDYPEKDILAQFDRFEPTSGVYSLQELVNQINATGYFIATLLSGADPTSKSMTIFNQISIGLQEGEDIANKGTRIQLEHLPIIPNSLSLVSSNLTEKVLSEAELIGTGKYYIDSNRGLMLTTTSPATDSIARYKYRNDNFIVRTSPVIIHNLQSDDFKTKMFEEIDEGILGLPTRLGADTINELLSVFSTSYAK